MLTKFDEVIIPKYGSFLRGGKRRSYRKTRKTRKTHSKNRRTRRRYR
jgi:hypothetical protein